MVTTLDLDNSIKLGKKVILTQEMVMIKLVST